MVKRTWILDTEVYPNYVLIGFKAVDTGEVCSVEVDGPDRRLSKEDRLWLRKFMRRNRTVGFNSIGFDLPIIYGAASGLTVRELKRMADDIIVGGMKSWEIEGEYGVSIPRAN